MLPLDEWRALAEEHRSRVEVDLAEVVWRRDRGIKQPIEDFLFHYYNLRPSHLAQWHPGIGVMLEDDGTWRPPAYVLDSGIAQLDREYFLAKRGRTVAKARELLSAVSNKEPRYGCFGMHEWAMVYRLAADETRHPYLKLRLTTAEIAEVVEQVGCRCSHYDAFRFFTAPARPLNLVQPTRQNQPELDQPGCLHVNMDLYKWAGKLWPAVGSDLLYETFRLAREIRVVDMRASAYDLRDWGHEPIQVETHTGRRHYVALQKEFASRASLLRERLLRIISGMCAQP